MRKKEGGSLKKSPDTEKIFLLKGKKKGRLKIFTHDPLYIYEKLLQKTTKKENVGKILGQKRKNRGQGGKIFAGTIKKSPATG